jgi:hypothetical protein
VAELLVSLIFQQSRNFISHTHTPNGHDMRKMTAIGFTQLPYKIQAYVWCCKKTLLFALVFSREFVASPMIFDM